MVSISDATYDNIYPNRNDSRLYKPPTVSTASDVKRIDHVNDNPLLRNNTRKTNPGSDIIVDDPLESLDLLGVQVKRENETSLPRSYSDSSF